MNTNLLEFKRSIESWDEGVPLGDGKLGSLIYGKGPLLISVDRVDLWDNRPSDKAGNPDFTYAEMVRLAKSGDPEDWQKHKWLFDDYNRYCPHPSKINAGRLILDFKEVTDRIYSRLDIKKAYAEVTFPSGKRLTAFNSATEHLGVYRIWGDYTLDIHIPDYVSGDEHGRCAMNTGLNETADNWCLQYPHSKVVKDGGFTYYVQETATDFRYTLAVLESRKDSSTELFVTVVTSDEAPDVLAYAKAQLTEAQDKGYDALFLDHVKWWQTYNARSHLTIPDKEMERLYNVYNYQLASCSREGFYPMALQGVWTADNDSLPPWKGDYHFDTNVELSYQSYLKANRINEGKVLVDYLWNMRDVYRAFAKSFYGVDGYLIPSTSSLSGEIIGGWPMYSYSPTMTVWAIQSLDEYYLYTGDEGFLKEKLYPIFEDTGRALLALMEERDGRLYLPLSSSPELFDNTKEAYLEPNTNFDLALLIYLYTKLRDYSRKLRKNYKRYEEILKKLDPLAISKSGTLMIDRKRELHESHRHFSHIMAIYPLHLISYDTPENKRIIEATINQIERFGVGLWCGFSFGMCAQLYAMAGKGNAVHAKLTDYMRALVADNGFHLNGDFKNTGLTAFHYRPFTMESHFSFNDSVQLMLMQEHEGYLNLLPALPDAWCDLEFKKLRSYGGLLVSLKLESGVITSLELTARKASELRIKDVRGLSELLGVKAEKGFITLKLNRGTVKFTKS